MQEDTYLEKCDKFLKEMELCNTQDELDSLCQKECIIHYQSKMLQQEVYRKRSQIINKN